ncbi:hypothetical protein Ciccas_009597 [Cichlidogyrus casuarinus]|uniref:O-acyltransferase n=1 Tax=Cichlidogyrus casuarinus TaxID=1844966 RepID=A0ABD2PXJ6_9PLAT
MVSETKLKQRKNSDQLDPPKRLNESTWKDISELTKQDIIRTMESNINENFDRMLNRIVVEASTSQTDLEWMLERTKDKRVSEGRELPEKVFMHRESLLTGLLRISHIRAVYNMFAAILFLIAAETVISDFLDIGSFRKKYHVEMFTWVFGKFGHTSAIWISMQLNTLALFGYFNLWAQYRSGSTRPTLFDLVALTSYIVYQASHNKLAFMTFYGWLVFYLELPPGSSIMLGMELSRIMMKSHAFVRSNIPKAFYKTASVKSTDGSKMSSGSDCPKFSHFLYFLFAPTLVYRDQYPRTDKIRWSFVLSNAVQFLLCVFYTYFILFRFCFTKFENFAARPLSISETLQFILNCMLPGGMLMYLAFFSFLHSWLNMFAELMTFGDRLFYKDWWNSRSFSTYYRTWNVVVHDWLYTYIYLDVANWSKKRTLATTLVFAVSAIMHEFILCMTFKFFYPVLLVLFGGAGFLLVFFKTRNRFWNLSFFANMCLGLGIEIALYASEWYARKHCPPIYPDHFWLDLTIPRSLFCNMTAANNQ